MDYKKLFWGAVLVIIGTTLILKNLGVIAFSWHALFHLWPVLLILWGISVLPVKDIWKLLISLLVLVLTIIYLYKGPMHDEDGWSFRFGEEDKTTWSDQSLSEEYDSTIHTAIINLDAAAGSFTLSDSTRRLIDFSNKGEIGSYSMEVERKGDTAVIALKMHSPDGEVHVKNRGNESGIRLNTAPAWQFNVDVGAASVDMDFSPYKVTRIDLDGGASSIELKLGARSPETHVDLETGAASIRVLVPESSGCEVVTSTFLSSRNLDGFDKVADKTYRTANFSTAASKVFIQLDAAISSIEVERY